MRGKVRDTCACEGSGVALGGGYRRYHQKRQLYQPVSAKAFGGIVDPIFLLVFASKLYVLSMIVLSTQVDRLACDQGDYLLVLAALGGVMAFLIIVVIPHILIYLFAFQEFSQFIQF